MHCQKQEKQKVRSVANKPFSPKVSIKNAEKIAKQVAVIQKKADVQIKAIKKQAEQKNKTT